MNHTALADCADDTKFDLKRYDAVSHNVAQSATEERKNIFALQIWVMPYIFINTSSRV